MENGTFWYIGISILIYFETDDYDVNKVMFWKNCFHKYET